jgi:hypothetical protein
VGRRGAVAVNGGGAGAVVVDDEALALYHGERERDELGSRMTENGRGWWLTELVNSSGDATEIQGGAPRVGRTGR